MVVVESFSKKTFHKACSELLNMNYLIKKSSAKYKLLVKKDFLRDKRTKRKRSEEAVNESVKINGNQVILLKSSDFNKFLYFEYFWPIFLYHICTIPTYSDRCN